MSTIFKGELGMASKRKLKIKPMEPGGPTPERLLKTGGDFERGHTGQYTLRDSPLERLHARRIISDRQYSAACKYRLHWHRAGLDPAPQSVDLNRIFARDEGAFSGMARTESQAFHRQQYRDAVRAIGIIGAAVMDRVACYEFSLEDTGYKMGWKSKPKSIDATKRVLVKALDKLCGLWGV